MMPGAMPESRNPSPHQFFVPVSQPSEVEHLRAVVEKQNAELKRISEVTKHIGVLLASDGKRGVVQVIGGPLMEAPIPSGLVPGDSILCSDRGQVFGALTGFMRAGNVHKVAAVLDDGRVELADHGGSRLLRVRPGLELGPGDQVMTDTTNSIVIECVRTGVDTSAQKVGEFEPVGWDDIAGCDDAKEALREAAVYPFTHAKLHEAYGGSAPKGVLLYGPPGCGKTMLGRALATALRKGKGGGYFYVKGPELLDKFVGETERSVRTLFATARAAATAEGCSVVFLDEADALLGSRTSGMFMNVSKTVVPAFLAEMDGLTQESGVVVLLATNRPDQLDSAAVRPGRVDRRVEVKRPQGTELVGKLFELYLRNLPVNADARADDDTRPAFHALSKVAAEAFCTQAVFEGVVGSAPVRLTLEHVASGALVEGVVRRAARLAEARDRAAGNKKPSGINRDDLHAALRAEAREVPSGDVQDALAPAIEAVRQKANGAAKQAEPSPRILVPGG